MPVDELKIVSCWDPKLLAGAKLALTVRGLLLQGCNFDGQKLTEALLNSASHSVRCAQLLPSPGTVRDALPVARADERVLWWQRTHEPLAIAIHNRGAMLSHRWPMHRCSATAHSRGSQTQRR